MAQEMSPTKKWAVQNTVYLEAETYEEAVKEFWRLMDKARIGVVTLRAKVPNCFVSEVERVAQRGNPE